MPLQNRVGPDGVIFADPARGMFTGNRGVLHDERKELGAARWRHPHWIVCSLDYKGIRRQVMTPRRWTELFFLDEAVAFAAGHRPCALCRREAYERYRDGWQAATGERASASEIDRVLHAARIEPRSRRQFHHEADFTSLPAGAFVWWDNAAWLVLTDRLRRYTPSGYTETQPRPAKGKAEVMTPAPTVVVLAQGYRPVLHPSA